MESVIKSMWVCYLNQFFLLFFTIIVENRKPVHVQKTIRKIKLFKDKNFYNLRTMNELSEAGDGDGGEGNRGGGE
jgi:hypothetical protein